MKLTLLSLQGIQSLVLPEKHAGQYWLRGRNSQGKMENILAVESAPTGDRDGAPAWTLKSNRRFKIIDREKNILQSVKLNALDLLTIRSEDERQAYVLYVEPLSNDRKRFFGYEMARPELVLTIGREGNHINYANRLVSGRHAELIIANGQMTVKDLGSANNTYVNGKVVRESTLMIGDVIYIMGLQIVVMKRHLFINNPDGNVVIQSDGLSPYRPQVEETVLDEADSEFEDIADDYYFRAPRFKYDVDTFELTLDPPPAGLQEDDLPTIMLIGPSMTMGMASIATGAFAVTNAIGRGDIGSALPSIVMSISMLLGTLLWPFITRRYQRNLKAKKEARRQKRYREYLFQVEERIERETARQEQVLRNNDVNTAACVSRILAPSPQIWERTPKHTDFLSLRLGYGNVPLKATIRYAERRFNVEHDQLTEAMYQLGEKKRWLSDVPVCLSITERIVSGFYANKQLLFQYAKAMILQIVAQHSYDEVKIALIYDEGDASHFAFAKWLPHTMNDEKTVRYIATNSNDVKQLSATLDPIIEYRKTLGQDLLDNESPHVVIICLDQALTIKTECVRRVLEHKEYLKFSVISFFERLKDLPKECSAVIELRAGSTGNMTLINDVSEPPIPFYVDTPQQIDTDGIARVLANIVVDIHGTQFVLPKKYAFLEMLDVGMIEHLNLLDNWSTNDPAVSLSAVVGVDRHGEAFNLDLHERAHGPHGLIAGMTGSGKSEFIITYILSLAVNFHPHEVAFILIDYKGGGMAASFEHIPHTAGIITNLDGNEIKRSLASMRSELHRRERIFRDVSLQHNVSNIDIYKYQKLYREQKVSEPLPHLFIVADEFAELKKEQPEFMEELTSTARIGRSLGVHLLLATQKPGGVVDDQIRSNSRFRVCLKVQDRADSQEMLDRPEAAELVDTGRFYLQVGNNELFEIGQSAWAGAPYYPSPKVIRDRDDAISVINTSGRVIAEVNTDRFALFKDPPKQLDIVTDYIREIADKEGISQWKMWLDPIPARIFVDLLEAKYGEEKPRKFALQPIIGEYDDPANQSQGICRIPLSGDGNSIVYGSAGSGKSMFIEAMCYSLFKHHTPNEVNVYLLDFGAETLMAFEKAPHVGGVILSHESEKIRNLFKLISGMLASRKKLLAPFGGDLSNYNEQTNRPEPYIVVVINNIAAFSELYDDLSGELNYLTREGLKYGVTFVLTATGVNNVRFALLQNFKHLYCLQLNNPDDYHTVVGKTDGLLPEPVKGRGLLRYDQNRLFEFQVASISEDESATAFIRDFSTKLASTYAGSVARVVPVLPERVSEKLLTPHIDPADFSQVPVGVARDSLKVATFDFTKSPVNLMLAEQQEWQAFSDAFATMLGRRYGVHTMVLAASGQTRLQRKDNLIRVFSDMESSVQAAYDIFDLVLTRNNAFKDALTADREAPDFEHVFVIIQSIALLKVMLERHTLDASLTKEADDDTPLNRLQIAMTKCDPAYNVHFLVGESVNALTPFTVENWYKEHIHGNEGLWVGDGIYSQYRLTLKRQVFNVETDLGADFGYIVENAVGTCVKLLQLDGDDHEKIPG